MKGSIFAILICLLLGACIPDEPIKINLNAQPETLSDGWIIGTPQAAGFDESILQEAVRDFFDDEILPNSKALLIAKNGSLVLEAYFKDLDDRDRLHNVKSVTKSITSTVVGRAIQQEIISPDLDRTVYSYIPENFDDDVRKREITMRHCLRMSTGLADPFITVSVVLPGNSISQCIGAELINSPGERHGYNNGSANILGGVISKASDLSYEDYVRNNLWNPLGITDYHWVKHNDDRVNAAFDLYLKPRDVLKWGQFCLQNGTWEGQSLLPPTWIDESTSYFEDGFDGRFGYHWWINDEHQAYYANGHGGQRVWVVPSQNLVVVHLSEPSTDQTDLTEIPVILDRIMEAL